LGVEVKLQKAFNREPVLLDPRAKSIPGPPMSILSRFSNPIFAGLGPVVGASKRGVEFMSFVKLADAAENGNSAKKMGWQRIWSLDRRMPPYLGGWI
jgi:hypothetical protein